MGLGTWCPTVGFSHLHPSPRDATSAGLVPGSTEGPDSHQVVKMPTASIHQSTHQAHLLLLASIKLRRAPGFGSSGSAWTQGSGSGFSKASAPQKSPEQVTWSFDQ